MPLPTKSNVSRPLADGYEALVETPAESLYLRLAPAEDRQMVLETVVEEQLPDLASNPEELRSETGRTFGRDDFTGGEGLDYAHRRNGEERDASRFWVSGNIDVSPPSSGETREIKLLPETPSIRNVASGVARAAVARVGTVLYAVASTASLVDRTADPAAATPTWTTEDPGGTGNITDLAVLGDELYAVRGGEIRKRDSAGVWTSFWAGTHQRAWGVKGRILAADAPSTGGRLYTSDGNLLLHTLPAGAVWNDVSDAGGAILAAGSNGYIYAFVEENGALTLKGETLMEGETPTALAVSQGLVFIGTSEPTTGGGAIGRLWRSHLSGLRLRQGQVLREWGTGTATGDHSPKRIITTREAVYTGILDPDEAGTSALWKYHLVTGGLSKDMIQGDAAALVDGIAVFDDRLFFACRSDGIHREAATYSGQGFLIGPLADFFSAQRKAWVGGRLQTGAVPNDAEVRLYYSTDPAALEDRNHASWTLLTTATSGSLGDGTELPITGVESRYLAGQLQLDATSDNTGTPIVHAFAFRGKATATEEDIPLVVNLSDRLELPGRKPLTVNGAGDAVYEKLLDLKGDNVTLTLFRPDKVYKGQIVRVRAPITGVPRKGSPTTYGLVWVRGQLQ